MPPPPKHTKPPPPPHGPPPPPPHTHTHRPHVGPQGRGGWCCCCGDHGRQGRTRQLQHGAIHRLHTPRGEDGTAVCNLRWCWQDTFELSAQDACCVLHWQCTIFTDGSAPDWHVSSSIVSYCCHVAEPWLHRMSECVCLKPLQTALAACLLTSL